MEAQFSRVYGFATGDFDEDKIKDILVIGNFDGSSPRMGRSDASFGVYMKGLRNNNYVAMAPEETGFFVFGETRDIKVLKDDENAKYVLVSRNNAIPKLFQVKMDNSEPK